MDAPCSKEGATGRKSQRSPEYNSPSIPFLITYDEYGGARIVQSV
jgi:hypothetical protein